MRAVSLAMYDPPWLQAETDALWTALRPRLPYADVPDRLDRSRDLHAVLTDPALLLGQTCGYPLLNALSGQVQLVATPVYDVEGCDGPTYCSFLVVRDVEPARRLDELRGRVAAVNGWDSNSGHNVFRAAVAPLAKSGRFFGSVLVTGAHLESLAAIRAGRADVAAIDCVTHGLAARHRPELLAGTRVLGRTAATPSLPFVTARATPAAEVSKLRQALASVLPVPALGLIGVEWLSWADYAPISELERAALRDGYPRLA